jgi:hypothetical protein
MISAVVVNGFRFFDSFVKSAQIVSILKNFCKFNVKYLIFDTMYEIYFAAWLHT